MKMELKKIAAKSGLVSKHTLTLKDIPALAEQVIPQLYAEAEATGLEVCGPVEFIYTGLNGGMDSPFELSILIPIAKRKKTKSAKPFIQDRTKPFRCAAAEHNGSMETIRITYSALFDTLKRAEHKTTDEFREVYHNWVSYYSPFNVTEIQVGLA